MDWTLSRRQFKNVRAATLAEVTGSVCEIGFGTGLNLTQYPAAVTRVTAVDPNPGMNQLAQSQIVASHIPVERHVLGAERLPLEDESFDSVVCTWTLCSIPGVEQALQEMRRVLKPEGQFFFVEHGLADDAVTRQWQHRLTPLQKRLADGCHLNRDIRGIVQDNGFRFLKLDTFCLRYVPKFVGFMYQGIAVKI